MKLKDISKYRSEKIKTMDIKSEEYISTDNMLPNFAGVGKLKSFPNVEKVNKYCPNDILISNIRPYFKKMIFSNCESGCSSDVLVIETTDVNVNPKYLYYRLRNSDFFDYVVSTSKGTKMPRGDKSAIMDFEIEVPDIKEQNKIVTIMERIDRMMEHDKKVIELLREVGTIYYQSMFEAEENSKNFELKRLDEVTINNRNRIEKDKEYKVLSAVNSGDLILSDEYFDKKVYSKNIEKYLNVDKNDFAYNPARINIGSIGCNTYDFNCCVSPVYVTFSVDENYINFFNYYFKSRRFNAEVSARASGSVRQTLNYNDFGLIELYYPPIDMIKIFNKVDNILKNKIDANKKKIVLLEELINTLLPKLINGEIDLDKVEV